MPDSVAVLPQTRDRARLRIVVTGLVQGVGFRPFVYRCATELGLTGWVRNSVDGVHLEIEGERHRLEECVRRLRVESPPRSRLDSVQAAELVPAGYQVFGIRASDDHRSAGSGQILPDIATCEDCRRELFDPGNRRFRYPFTNCTHCGPRFSIIHSLPYDRARTTMRVFPMCAPCRAEFEDPRDRRFHAQPIACPQCGPHLELWDQEREILAQHDEALRDAAERVRQGEILAIKGLGGFQLVLDAANTGAVERLRKRKNRPDKPFALMYPDLDAVRRLCEISSAEEQALASPESPIVLLRCKPASDPQSPGISSRVAPDNPYLGIMLPYTPLHLLLVAELRSPLLMTSGNLADEPICIDEHEACARLGGIAVAFLVHNRPIARPMDDSVVQFVAGRVSVLRCARGFAPVSVELRAPGEACLAVGAHQKDSLAVSDGQRAFLGQHIGDLSSTRATEVFEREARSLARAYRIDPARLYCDKHPDYASTRFVKKSGQPYAQVQHHFAHVASCMAEHRLEAPVLGVSWDGTGLGDDGTVWGGEFIRVSGDGTCRFGHLRPFSLPGGDKASVEPRRSALGQLAEVFKDSWSDWEWVASVRAFAPGERGILQRMLSRSLNAPRSSSAGRLFDAVASITGICQVTSFEGQAAMRLQYLAESAGRVSEAYDFGLSESNAPCVVDWEAMLHGVLSDLRQSVPIAIIAAKFHRTLAEMITAVAVRAGERRVVLTGGCFQNRLLCEWAITALQQAGFEPFWHERIPSNDGGIALGQICLAGQLTMKGT